MAALASWGWQHPGDLRIARGPCPIEMLSEMDFPKIAAAATTSDQHRAPFHNVDHAVRGT
jgi:hypothetical protein